MATASSSKTVSSKIISIKIFRRTSDRTNCCSLVSLDSRQGTARGLCLDRTEIAAIDRGAKQIGPDNVETRR